MVGLCVFVCVDRFREPCKNGWPDQDAVEGEGADSEWLVFFLTDTAPTSVWWRLRCLAQDTCITWGQDPPRGRSNFWGLSRPSKSTARGIIQSSICRASRSRLPPGQCHIKLSPPWKIRPLQCSLLSKFFDHVFV